jgi:predicted component of type VI protein secretion system
MEIKYSEMVCREIVEKHLRPLLNEGKHEEMVRKWGEIVADPMNIYK